MSDPISRQAAVNATHDVILSFIDVDDEERPITSEDKILLEVNKAITTRIKALPTAQSPKTFHVTDVLTGKEADPYEIALNEDWAKGLMYCDMEGFAIEEDGSLILVDECGRYEYCPIGRFEVVWDE